MTMTTIKLGHHHLRAQFACCILALALLLVEWERWSAELLESHISYPLLCYFRSQHTNQSWISALTAVLDTSALLIAGVQGHEARQAQLGLVAVASQVLAGHSAIAVKIRPVPLPPRVTGAERAAHNALVETLGEKAIWSDYAAASPAVASSRATGGA